MLRQAIARVPQGNDYIILDRCAGTGNLEQYMADEELSHCIVSTVEYYEYKVLMELIGYKVRAVIPPTETGETFRAGLVSGADALTREYIENPIIRRYVDDPKYTIILFENPPYAETTSIEHQKAGVGTSSSSWKNSFVVSEMRKEVRGTASNDLGNAFIWSGFKFYLRQPSDSYIVYSPVKYWKAQHLIDRQFLAGFAFNRRHFHTSIDACIMVALWANIPAQISDFSLDAFDIDRTTGALISCGQLPVLRTYSLFSQKYYDKRKFPDDLENGIFAEFDGLEASAGRASIRITPVWNENILGYLAVKGANFDNPDSCVHLLTVGAYDANGFYLRRDNYLEKLPMFCASRYITYNTGWTERGRIMKSADGADRFYADLNAGKLDAYLLKCLLFTCLEMQNHMRTFTGSDGRFYRNELCLDGTNGDTLAIHGLRRMEPDQAEEALFAQWEAVIACARETENYDPALTYGVYQIYDELNTMREDEVTGKSVPDYVELNTALQRLKGLVKAYYNAEIVPTLFRYEFLK